MRARSVAEHSLQLLPPLVQQAQRRQTEAKRSHARVQVALVRQQVSVQSAQKLGGRYEKVGALNVDMTQGRGIG